ncbi:alpha-ribazole kinase [Fervidicella metallireducens AeB]|uniref:Alpha-ribazole kinase n=1 Tax=Fervidicella metallireducens AeB TaxID=1403537 RepID=A0A017RW55_9CLOT|nr:AIR synthase related protein [Fervidicella metallireducens]EYE88912.1 alpha-ribazole kinase [Fervidicella metallireducens AeB]
MKFTHRDIQLLELDSKEFLVISCDSCGGVGLKENDIVKASPYIVGKFTARVCLSEILSLKAKPMTMSISICSEPEPTGEEIIKGIKDELKEIDLDIPLIISTEKNIKTSMTALGISVFGRVKKESILLDKVKKGDFVYILGEPCVGDEVLKNVKKICTTKDIFKVVNDKNVCEVIPVGSSGIKGEMNKFMEETGLEFYYEDDIKIDINKSAGPCTAAIVIGKLDFSVYGYDKIRKIGYIK